VARKCRNPHVGDDIAKLGIQSLQGVLRPLSRAGAHRKHDHERRRISMTVAKITEISCRSTTSFEDAIQQGITRADQTLDQVKGAWVSEMKVEVEGGKVVAYQVNLRVTFVLRD
jgi:hypothetical protein